MQEAKRVKLLWAREYRLWPADLPDDAQRAGWDGRNFGKSIYPALNAALGTSVTMTLYNCVRSALHTVLPFGGREILRVIYPLDLRLDLCASTR